MRRASAYFVRAGVLPNQTMSVCEKFSPYSSSCVRLCICPIPSRSKQARLVNHTRAGQPPSQTVTASTTSPSSTDKGGKQDQQEGRGNYLDVVHHGHGGHHLRQPTGSLIEAVTNAICRFTPPLQHRSVYVAFLDRLLTLRFSLPFHPLSRARTRIVPVPTIVQAAASEMPSPLTSAAVSHQEIARQIHRKRGHRQEGRGGKGADGTT